MSSINSSDRSRQTDELRRTREEYENREAENAKKQKKEIRRLTERHSQDVKEITDSYENRIDGFQEKSRQTMTKRDENHREQVDQIRSMYHEQLRRKTEDSEANQKTLRTTLSSELGKQGSIKDQQRNELERNFRDALRERDQQLVEHTEKSREVVKSSLTDRTEKMNSKHEKELEAIAQDRDRKIYEMQKNSGEQKSYFAGELKAQERRAASEKGRIESNWKSIVEDQAALNSTVLDNRNQLLKAERDALRENFQVKMGDEQLKNETLRENLTEVVGERMDRQIRRSAYELGKAQNEKVQGDLVSNRMRKIEKENIVNAYEARMQDLRYQKDQTQVVAKDLASKRIGEMADKSERILRDANRRNKDERQMASAQNREERSRLITDGATKVQRAEERADTMIGNIKNASNETQLVQNKYYQRNLDQMKESYIEELSAQREAQLGTLAKIRTSMEDKMRTQDTKNQNKLETVVKNYEDKLKGLQESHTAELARLKTQYESRADQRDKSHGFESESVARKYQLRLAQQQEEHQKEIDRVQRRHHETLADMNSRMGYSKKKV